ncbi:RDD family protein [Geobacillus kaustophilus]|uniref:RDD family protein n=1 Tax=Geobacillus kaustophilus TaxID=1462 RepID=UPI0005CDC453|nr:RDD family protein [Geobacillus kaustophilus]
MAVANPAGFWKRLLANLLDAIVVGIPISIIGYLITGSWETNWFTSLANILYALIVPAVWYGYTVGKRMLGIRIAKVNGGKVGIGTMFLRSFVGGLVYFITFGIGLIISAIMVAAREDKRSIHDFIAGTYVTTEKPTV